MTAKNGIFFFVVQKHVATSLHYDFRLEIGEVMQSWAIPKGPTLDPKIKRLAMKTTDHATDYRHFEGVLTDGVYGGGPVMIWDEGTYIPEMEGQKGVREAVSDEKEGKKVMQEGLEKGEIKFVLYGKKLSGSFALIKTKNFGPKNAWLLIKHNDAHIKENYDASLYDISAVTKRSLEQIKQAK